jgi:hypothetical protein
MKQYLSLLQVMILLNMRLLNHSVFLPLLNTDLPFKYPEDMVNIICLEVYQVTQCPFVNVAERRKVCFRILS